MLIDRRHLMTKALAVTSVSMFPRCASAASESLRFPAVTKLVDNYIVEKRFASVAAAVSSSGSTPSFFNAGSLAFGSREPITPDALFRIYSVTKVFTAVLTLMMFEDGLLRLDQPLADIIPEFRQMNVAVDPKTSLEARPTIKPITIEHLLTHRSGLSNWQPFLGENPVSNAYRQRGLTPGAYGIHKQRDGYGPQVHGLDALVSGLAQLPLIAEPGAAWNYSIGYDVLGAVIERVTGTDFATVMEKRILAPLKMSSTGFQVPPSQTFRLTTLYGRTGENTYVIDPGKNSEFVHKPSLIAGGGGLVSSARDMAHFAQMLLGQGQFKQGRIAHADTINKAMQMFSTQRDSITTNLGGLPSSPAPIRSSAIHHQDNLSAVGASSTMLHVDRARDMFAVFLAQLNLSGSPAVATAYRPEFLKAIDADLNDEISHPGLGNPHRH
jgi:CubicO group peptidase (beta-lactamase class C family)